MRSDEHNEQASRISKSNDKISNSLIDNRTYSFKNGNPRGTGDGT